MSETQQQLTLPVAIVIAGILIAGAVFFSRPVDKAGNTNTPVAAGGVFFDSVIADLDLDTDDFYACLESDAAQQAVFDDTEEVLALGGGGTPFSVIQTANGALYAISGAVPYEAFRAEVDAIIDGSTELTPLVGEIRPVSESDFVLGNENGSVTVIEYSDFECPFCGRHHPTLERLVAENSEVRWVYRHYPLASIHPQATIAAVAGECIAEQAGDEGFWQYADFIFKNQRLLQTAPYQG